MDRGIALHGGMPGSLGQRQCIQSLDNVCVHIPWPEAPHASIMEELIIVLIRAACVCSSSTPTSWTFQTSSSR